MGQPAFSSRSVAARTFCRRRLDAERRVQDFSEVDNNVTRHIPTELRRQDWNTMVLHFLGLDHIGHKAGPERYVPHPRSFIPDGLKDWSPNMMPKQIEMDGIVRRIYEAIEHEKHLESALFVLCGDHGMNEGGNHGGSAPGETSPALVFMSPKLRSLSRGLPTPAPSVSDYQYYAAVEQSDIVPTLAGLLGFPVPKNNLGLFIPDFLELWGPGL